MGSFAVVAPFCALALATAKQDISPMEAVVKIGSER
jgi:hypothetical protein